MPKAKLAPAKAGENLTKADLTEASGGQAPRKGSKWKLTDLEDYPLPGLNSDSVLRIEDADENNLIISTTQTGMVTNENGEITDGEITVNYAISRKRFNKAAVKA